MSNNNQQQFVKNTNVPEPTSWLWEIGKNWRYSGGSGDCYCPLKYDEKKEISDLQLFTAMKELLNKPVSELDYVEYKQGYFVPVKTSDGNGGLLYVYPKQEEEKAKKKVDNIKKYSTNQSSSQPQQQQQIQTQSQQQQQNKPSLSPTLTSTDTSFSIPTMSSQIQQTQSTILTFTDPKWIDDEDRIKDLQSQGYSFIPASLCQPNSRVIDVHDIDAETGKDVVIGENYAFLMGRIIRVKISDN